MPAHTLVEHRVMGVFVLDMDDVAAARALYGDMPAPLKADTELRTRLGGAEVRTAKAEAARWVKARYAEQGARLS